MAVKIKIAIGKENFDTIRKNGSYYVDKTELLYELVHKTTGKIPAVMGLSGSFWAGS